MDITQQIISLRSFQDAFNKMAVEDPEIALNISSSLQKSVDEFHKVLSNPSSTVAEKKVALLQEQITIQAQASRYLNISEEMAIKERNLLQYIPMSTQIFFDDLFDKLDNYFHEKGVLMHREIERDGEWYSGIRDSAKKTGTILNWAVKKANDVAVDLGGSKITSNDKVIDERSIVEKVMEKHLSPNKVGNEVTTLLNEASKSFQGNWEKMIKSQVPSMNRLSAFSLAKQANNTLTIDFKMGTSEQTLVIGIGSAVAGSIGLAMGWHTITYALLNVFPPVALFAVVASIAVGFATKQEAIKKRKEQITSATRQYQQQFLTQFNVTPLKELKNLTLQKHMLIISQKIVTDTIKQWEKNLFGNLNTEHYRLLVSAFTKHLLLIQEELESLENTLIV
ncbi:hypothetical protein CVD28_18540 [Bacillus sp. M6-12]|uniref:hypothetical protein n=1 Tax=Bacillus sp. M6-12 TaxID=2054166 RepID=UPI000C78D21F|nr:hypothetical protein [Bacillus sp. M6-12]PLS16048.1 hypothetical protein CVD28_18540 [Bacillus sp. M6-12]